VRRDSFVRVCSLALAAQVQMKLGARAAASQPASFNRVELVDEAGSAIRADGLGMAQAFVFQYPYRATPCFLIRLGRTAAGGVGPDGAVVAFSAICAHQLSYPSREVSPIRYAQDYSQVAERSGAIVCCAHHSVYDPADGARVLSGPAPQPLATIVLDHDTATDRLYATGVHGPDRFDDFFTAYKEELIDAYGRGKERELVTESATIVLLDRYTSDVIVC
jgi:arsenite oxidase small subunit